MHYSLCSFCFPSFPLLPLFLQQAKWLNSKMQHMVSNSKVTNKSGIWQMWCQKLVCQLGQKVRKDSQHVQALNNLKNFFTCYFMFACRLNDLHWCSGSETLPPDLS